MKQKRVFVVTLLVLFALSLLVGVQANSYADVTGTWKLTVVMQDRTTEPSVTFKQEGEELSGTYKGRLGEAPLKGSVKGNAIKFSFKLNAQGNELQIEYDGTIEGDTIKGKAKFGDFGEGTFSGKKQ